MQCQNCSGFSHKAVACSKAQLSCRRGGPHSWSDCNSPSENCVSCGGAHEASPYFSGLWMYQQHVIEYAKTDAMNMRSSRTTIHQLIPSTSDIHNAAAPVKGGTTTEIRPTYAARARGCNVVPSVRFKQHPVRHRYHHLWRNTK